MQTEMVIPESQVKFTNAVDALRFAARQYPVTPARPLALSQACQEAFLFGFLDGSDCRNKGKASLTFALTTFPRSDEQPEALTRLLRSIYMMGWRTA